MKAICIRRGAHGSALRRALIVSAATVIAVPALATDAHATHQRLVTGRVAMRIMDYESVGENAVCHRNFALTSRVITVGTPRSFVARATCSGEIRVEVHYKLTHDQNGVIRVTEGIVKFFEGASVNTGDLDGTSAFRDMILFPGLSLSRNIHVQNWNEGQSDDKADVTLTLRN